MPKVVGKAGNHSLEVYYGKRFTRKDFRSALREVKVFLVDASNAGFNPVQILHYPDDRKKCKPETIPFND